MSALELARVTLAHEGHAALRNRFARVCRQRAACPNAVWQAARTGLDVSMPVSEGTAVGAWLTAIVDAHARAIAGYRVFFGAPSSLQTSLALRQASWRNPGRRWPVSGIPDGLYVDHGSAVTSTRILSRLRRTRTSNRCIRPSDVLGAGAWGARLFGTLKTELLPELPGHLSGSQAGPPKLSLPDPGAAVGALSSAPTTRVCIVKRERGRGLSSADTRSTDVCRLDATVLNGRELR